MKTHNSFTIQNFQRSKIDEYGIKSIEVDKVSHFDNFQQVNKLVFTCNENKLWIGFYYSKENKKITFKPARQVLVYEEQD